MTAILEAFRVGRQVGEQWLLQEISVSVAAGSRLALVGESGSGKTLLLRSLALLDPVQAGEIRWRGKTPNGNDVPVFRSRVVYLHQRPSLREGTVEDNLRQPFSLRTHQTKQFDRERVVAWLQSLKRPPEFLGKRTRDLSGGELQLTALLRAIQLDCDVLLLDEPTASLDADATAMVESLVDHWLNEEPKQRAVVWVTHNVQQARRVSATSVQLRGGRLVGA